MNEIILAINHKTKSAEINKKLSYDEYIKTDGYNKLINQGYKIYSLPTYMFEVEILEYQLISNGYIIAERIR